MDYCHLKRLYQFINSKNISNNNLETDPFVSQVSVFWGSYWRLPRKYQPWVVAHLHRTLGLKEGDPFYQHPTKERTWLYSDMASLSIPCSMVWDWLNAATPCELESSCFLSNFTHKELYTELTRRIKADPNANKGYLFASMSMAMVFRMSLGTLKQDFSNEAHEWKTMYASWDLESRLFVLNVLACIDQKESRDYMYAWGPELFPEARSMLDVARATDVHPARLVRQWYDQQGHAFNSLAIEGLV